MTKGQLKEDQDQMKECDGMKSYFWSIESQELDSSVEKLDQNVGHDDPVCQIEPVPQWAVLHETVPSFADDVESGEIDDG